MSDHDERLKKLEKRLAVFEESFSELLQSYQHLLLAVVGLQMNKVVVSEKAQQQPHNKGQL